MVCRGRQEVGRPCVSGLVRRPVCRAPPRVSAGGFGRCRERRRHRRPPHRPLAM